MKYNSTTNSVLMLYEDHDEKWHKVDFGPDDENVSPIHSDFESTFDNKSVKFKVISVPKDGEGHVMKFGDDSDLDVEAGEHFPPIPPPLPESRLPRLIMDNQVSILQREQHYLPRMHSLQRLYCKTNGSFHCFVIWLEYFFNFIIAT